MRKSSHKQDEFKGRSAGMNDKMSIMKALSPRAVLKPLTDEAARAIANGMLSDGLIAIRQFPFRIGRESRFTLVDGEIRRVERPRLGGREPNNDLYLLDSIQPLHISREHLLIKPEKNGFVLVDRGSACGTLVNDVSIGGGDAGGSVPLKDGDTIAIGTATSPYRYAFITLEGAS
jgi:pSer/pThr/pTyr-binding forkhead associated (FHA) protein